MKIICLANNFAQHAQEIQHEIPEKPVFFLKPDTALLRNNEPFPIPAFSNEVHYELELVLKIKKLGKSIKSQFASRYYSEVGLGIDFTARDIQRDCKAKGLPWEIAKGFDYSAAISSQFIDMSVLPYPHNIHFWLDINGKIVQNGYSSDMLFKFDTILSHISQYMTLRTGDLIYTGTPPGVGCVHPGNRLKAYMEDQLLMDFRIV